MASLVNHSVTNLINGVSQQASAVRLDNQLEEQINCFSDVTKGLVGRNGLELKNKIEGSMADRIPIEFTLDGSKYVLGLDTTAPTQLMHLPLSADIPQLAASLESTNYFDNATAASLKIVEDKDTVYLLNTNKVVGTVESQSAYYDIRITNDSTGAPNTNWTTGSYTLSIISVATTGTKAESDIVLTVNSTSTRTNISDYINSQPLTTEIGPVTIKGDIGSYRLYFDNIPVGFATPVVTAVEATDIYGYDTYLEYTPASGWFGIYQFSASQVADKTKNGEYYRWEYSSWDNTSYLYWGNTPNTLIGTVSGNPTTAELGGFTYHKGNISTNYTLGVTNGYYYSIRRSSQQTRTYTYSVSNGPAIAGAVSVDSFSNSAAIWITGVSASQEYTVSLTYINSAGTQQTIVGSVSVSATDVSQIKLNYVAGNLASDLTAGGVFGTTVYSNAIYIYSNTDDVNEIISLDVDNNYDTTSISAAIRASTTNESAIEDIATLPPVFEDGFKVRVGTSEGTSETNYYLEYRASDELWKETGLDSSRLIDNTTLPYIIDKDKIRSGDSITIEEAMWDSPVSGDSLSNPDPSFVGTSIKDIFFYGSRLGMATESTLVMSQIDEPSRFYRSTCSSILTSDRVDIQLDSSKVGFSAINSVIPYDSKLLVNTANTQSVLLVNTSFDLTQARLTEVSSYTLGDFEPISVNNGIYFAVSNDNRTNIFNYTSGGNNAYEAVNITKHIPYYIEGNISRMAYGNDLAVVQTDADSSVLYVQNLYASGGQTLQNAWHKWELPASCSFFHFVDNALYLYLTLMDSSDVEYTMVSKFDITPQVIAETEDDVQIGWIPFLDLYTKDKTLIEDFPDFIGINDEYGTRYGSVIDAYESTKVEQASLDTATTASYSSISPVFYWNINGNTNEIIFNDEAPIITGNPTQAYFDHNGYRYFRGDESDDSGFYKVSRSKITDTTYNTNDIVYGIPFTVKAVLSEVVPRQQSSDGSYVVMNFATLMLRRMRLNLGNSGVFKASVSFEDRKDYEISYTGQPLGRILLGRASVSDINFKFPINGKSDKVTITITSDSSMPFNLLSYEWQGRLTQRGRNI